MLKRLLLGLIALVGVLAIAVAINTWRQGSRQLQVPAVQGVAVDERAAGESLAVAIRARTVSSYTDAKLNADQFQALHAHMTTTYPKLHAALKRELIGELSLLYTWQGSDASLKPIALMAHQDVVPIAPGTEGDWLAEPWSGTVREGYVWGRGSWDDKANLIAELEAVEKLVASGFKPRRTVYLVFGADEEVGGERGALQIAKLLQQRGVKLDFAIDEGLLITEGIMPGLKAPAALVGLAEKGSVSLLLQAKATPGHSSMPPAPGRSAIAQLSQAMQRVDAAPMPASLTGVAAQMFDAVGPEFEGFSRVALTNRWLFEPLLMRQLEKGQSTNAMLRTTTALTLMNAGNKENVLPGRAEATVNFRLLPGTSKDDVIRHVKQAIDDPAIVVTELPGGFPASRVSSANSASYQTINRTVRELFPGTLVAPGLMLGATDARHFESFTDNVYRFSPIRAKAEDLSRFHGTNERISLANLADLIRFYHRLVQQSAGG
ncbi:M20 family peptidase [Aquabacterium sp.]|uniref:M20 family peptidase n=1 Tax=Aquabacterium sp. TaxID=1872578 RepID=UPI002D161DE6|nr:M20 family peptidase [Aquabacterium sp.]HSW04751.1 M20 family peptidase [Aquabacterium sp.]